MTGRPPTRGHLFQFRLRTLWVVVTLAAIVCGWIAYERQQEQARLAALKALQSTGVFIFYDRQAPQPAWSRLLFGNDAGSNASSLCFPVKEVTHEDVTHIKRLGSIHVISFSKCDIETNGVLEDFTSHGILERDAANQLIGLDLEGTKVKDESLFSVGRLVELRWLNLRRTEVTDSGMVHLKSLSQLYNLALNYTAFGDAGLEHLKKLPQLEELDLRHTLVTDAGLHHLHEMKQLKVISLTGTQVTSDGIERLSAAIPGITVVR